MTDKYHNAKLPPDPFAHGGTDVQQNSTHNRQNSVKQAPLPQTPPQITTPSMQKNQREGQTQAQAQVQAQAQQQPTAKQNKIEQSPTADEQSRKTTFV